MNKLIADFMGTEVLDYDKSWCLLMPVIIKIESLGFIVSNDQSDTTILEKKAFSSAFIRVYGTYGGMSKIESYYKAACEFIELYNKK